MVRLQFSESCSEISWSFPVVDCPESGLVSDDLTGVPKSLFNCPMIVLGLVDCPVERCPIFQFLGLDSDIFLVGLFCPIQSNVRAVGRIARFG